MTQEQGAEDISAPLGNPPCYQSLPCGEVSTVFIAHIKD